jgi:DNA-binding NtrC family response regulator
MTYFVDGIDDRSPLFPDSARIILLSSDDHLRARLRVLLATRGCRIDEFVTPEEAAGRLHHLETDVVLVDAEGPQAASWERACGEFLTERALRPNAAPVVVIAPEQDPASAARLIDQGAADFITRACSNGDMVVRIGIAIRRHRVAFTRKGDPDNGARGLIVNPIERKPPTRSLTPATPATVPAGMVLGQSDVIRDILDRVHLVADKQTTVLINGETGTGKERIARALHAAGNRSAQVMVSVNCAGIPSNLLEDEFFGHVNGAFTDAHQNRVGRFEQARGGSIFLDEIGDLPLDLQPKLLRVLQERELHRIGGLETVRVDVRVIVATNADLWTNVQDGRFREDLFYRLNVFPIHLPALRERREDIPLFLNHFLEQFCRREGLHPKTIQAGAEADLMARAWPGDIRELENAVEIPSSSQGTVRCSTPAIFPIPAGLALQTRFASLHRTRTGTTRRSLSSSSGI